MYFIDTNVIVYANDRSAGDKQVRAVNVVTELLKTRQGVISIQVLQEYAFTAIKKLHQSTDVMLRQIRLLESMSVVIPEPSMVIRAVEIQISSQISFWDASIVAAAEQAQCHAILSEDLNAGQYYAGLPVINPLLESFTLKGSA